jgi:hypothetical protein
MTRNEQCFDQAHSIARPVAGKNRARQEVFPISVAYTKSCLRCPIDVLPAAFGWADFATNRIPPYLKRVEGASICILLYNAESQMRRARGLDRTCPPQFDPLRVEILEEPDAAAE